MKKKGTIIPLYNSTEYLEDLISSLELQTVPLDQLIFVDDASTDDTKVRFKSLMSRSELLRDKSHLICLKKNVGLSTAFNIGLADSDFEFLFFSGHDDIWLKNRVESTIAHATSSDASLIQTAYRAFGNASYKITPKRSHEETLTQMMKGNPIGAITVCLRLDLIGKDNVKLNPRFEGAEDYDLWTDIVLNGGRILSIQDELMLYRISKSQMSATFDYRKNPVHQRVRKNYLQRLLPSFREFERQLLVAAVFYPSDLGAKPWPSTMLNRLTEIQDLLREEEGQSSFGQLFRYLDDILQHRKEEWGALPRQIPIENLSKKNINISQTKISVTELRSTTFDVVFFCEQPSHWQNISEVLCSIIASNYKLKMALLHQYDLADYPEAIIPDEVLCISKFPITELKFLKTQILYTPHVDFRESNKPKNSKIIHSLVSFIGLDGVYTQSMFDSYDYILCAGPHHIADFKRLSKTRGQMKGKTLIPAGYPKIDLVSKIAKELPSSKPNEKTKVIYAPTHVYSANESISSLRKFAKHLLAFILKEGHEVIFRPHPVSLTDSDSVLIFEIARSFASNPNFQLDTSKEYYKSYGKSHVMITDVSGTGFTYSLAFGKPTIFFSPNFSAERSLNGIQFSDRSAIGAVARSPEAVIALIKQLKNEQFGKKIGIYKNKVLYNPDCSAKYIAGSIIEILNGHSKEEWVVLD
jgi:glycosyltransferase involved in cell wall biosynthesis